MLLIVHIVSAATAVGLAQSRGRELDCRVGGRGFDSWGRNEGTAFALQRLDLRVAWMTT